MRGVVMRQCRAGRRVAIPAAAVLLGGALSACSSSVFHTPASSFSGLFASSAPATNASGSAMPGSLPDFECPSVSIRDGASTLSVSANPNEDGALSMRYQVGIGTTARECRLNGSTVTMRVGMQGRVILGPAGAPGQIEVPVRMAVVHEGPSPKVIATKLNRVNVIIPPGDGNVQFTMIEDDISFPMPRGGVIDEYIIYIGFDPQAVREPAPKRPERAPRRG